MDRSALGDDYPLSEAHDGIENGAGRVGEGSAVDHGEGGADPATPAKKSRTVGLVLQIAHRLAFDRGQMGQPDLWLIRRAGASSRQQSLEPGYELGLHEEIRECAVGNVRALRSEHDLGIGGEIDLTIAVLQIRHRQAP
jgi:hypothetical protein